MSTKGSKSRVRNNKAYRENYDGIFNKVCWVSRPDGKSHMRRVPRAARKKGHLVVFKKATGRIYPREAK